MKVKAKKLHNEGTQEQNISHGRAPEVILLTMTDSYKMPLVGRNV